MATKAEAFSKKDLAEALRAIDSTIRKCEKIRPKLKAGTPQHTLLTRRLEAFAIAATLIKRELDPQHPGAETATDGIDFGDAAG